MVSAGGLHFTHKLSCAHDVCCGTVFNSHIRLVHTNSLCKPKVDLWQCFSAHSACMFTVVHMEEIVWTWLHLSYSVFCFVPELLCLTCMIFAEWFTVQDGEFLFKIHFTEIYRIENINIFSVCKHVHVKYSKSVFKLFLDFKIVKCINPCKTVAA